MKKSKLAAVLAVALLTVGATAACSSGNDSAGTNASPSPGASSSSDAVNATGFPIVNTPIKLTFFAGKAPSAPADWNQVEIWKEYAKMTNIDVDFQLTPVDSLDEKRNLTLSGGELPDAFHTSRLSAMDVANYGAQGLFIPLDDLIDKYAPNFKKLMDEHPEIKKGLTMPDGHIYSFPTYYDADFKSVLIGSELWLNEDFLNALGMKEPTTTDEFYQYLKAVKTGDPNKNGKNDEIPYAASGIGTLLDQLKGAWGLGNRGNMHPRVDIDPATNELRFIPTAPAYKELLQYMNKLYSEGLFIPDILTVKGPEVNANGKNGLYGSFTGTNARVSFGVADNHYVGAPAFKGPHGDQLFSRARSPLIDIGAFVITKANKHPEATVRWIDYFYSEEGSKMFFMGIKDKSYTENPDGTLSYLPEVANNSEEMNKYVSFAGGYYPAMLTAKTFFGGESYPENLEAARKVEPYWPQEVWPAFTYTADELAEFTPLNTDISKYVDEMTTKFVTGDASFDQWDNYVATLEKMGLKRYMEIYKAAYDRYKA